MTNPDRPKGIEFFESDYVFLPALAVAEDMNTDKATSAVAALW